MQSSFIDFPPLKPSKKPVLMISPSTPDVVFKRFATGAPTEDRLAAEWEYERQRWAYEALGDVAGVTVPRPLGLTAHPPGIRMERLPGMPLDDYLRNTVVSEAELAALAAALASGLSAYVDYTGEPYFDFCFGNLLYTPADGTVTFIDFGRPKNGGVWAPDATPMTVSLGNFLGWIRYELSRPSRWARPRVRRQYLSCYMHLIAHLQVTRDDFPPDAALMRFARDTYRQCGFAGSWLRRVWYRGIDLWRAVFLDPTLHA